MSLVDTLTTAIARSTVSADPTIVAATLRGLLYERSLTGNTARIDAAATVVIDNDGRL